MDQPPIQSWVEGANGPHGFGLNHLPYGAFRKGHATRLCVRIGGFALDLEACAKHGLMDELAADIRSACGQSTWNALLAAGPRAWRALRSALVRLLSAEGPARTAVERLLRPLNEVELVLPMDVGGYTDFYASLHHAQRVGELLRPGEPLLPNYKHLPIAYNGRASSLVVSGTPVRRPWGQRRPVDAVLPGQIAQPEFAPSAALDYELELAFVAGQGNALGEPIPIARASEHIFGVTLLNDWSARDVQAWEYQPLGPFLGKSFATSVSPWITPMAALEPFRVAPGVHDPQPLPYLVDAADQRNGALDIQVEVLLTTEASRAAGRAPMRVGRGNTRELFWTCAQMVAHHTSNGCNLKPGDLLATGTISGPERASAGCLLELASGGRDPLTLPNGEQRAGLRDGDEVTLRARCDREGTPSIVLGECIGRVYAAHTRLTEE